MDTLIQEAESVLVSANELEFICEQTYFTEASEEGFFAKIIRKIGECIQKLKDFLFGSKMKNNLDSAPATSNAEGKKIESQAKASAKDLEKLVSDAAKAKTPEQIEELRQRHEKIKTNALKVGAGAAIGTTVFVAGSFVKGLIQSLTATQEKCKKYVEQTTNKINTAELGLSSKVDMGVWKAKTSLLGSIAATISQFGSRAGIALLPKHSTKERMAKNMQTAVSDRNERMSRDKLISVQDQNFRRRNTDANFKYSDNYREQGLSDEDIANRVREQNNMLADMCASLAKYSKEYVDKMIPEVNKIKSKVMNDINSGGKIIDKGVLKDAKKEAEQSFNDLKAYLRELKQAASESNLKKVVINQIGEYLDNDSTYLTTYATRIEDDIMYELDQIYADIADQLQRINDAEIPFSQRLREIKNITKQESKQKIQNNIKKVLSKLPKPKIKHKQGPKPLSKRQQREYNNNKWNSNGAIRGRTTADDEDKQLEIEMENEYLDELLDSYLYD